MSKNKLSFENYLRQKIPLCFEKDITAEDLNAGLLFSQIKNNIELEEVFSFYAKEVTFLYLFSTFSCDANMNEEQKRFLGLLKTGNNAILFDYIAGAAVVALVYTIKRGEKEEENGKAIY